MSITKLLSILKTGAPFTTPKPTIKQKPVDIIPGFKHIVVTHMGHKKIIKRDQNNEARIPTRFTKTSRPCPPFCVQPMRIAKGIETIGELDVLDYLEQSGKGDNSILLVDSRMEDWAEELTIPSAINIPWTKLVSQQGATVKGIVRQLTQHFDVRLKDESISIDDIESAIDNSEQKKLFDYSSAKTLVMFCNGSWCGQTSESIKALLEYGYPTEKIKYYRGGIQGWLTLGLTTVTNNQASCSLH